jgi:serine protease Do
VDKEKINQQKQPSKMIILIMVAVASGFFGGYFGAQSDVMGSDNNDSRVQREIISNEGDLISTIAKDVGPSVVSVNVKSTGISQDFFGFGQQFEQQSAGTGVILSTEGYIITNRHVVPQGISEVTITLSDGTEVSNVEVVGRTNDSDPLDIAFLKIKDTTGLELKPANLGDSAQVEVGDRVVAIGNALGQFQNTVTSGIISGFGRDIEAADQNGANPESLQNLFQTDAAINGGNSGGPLVNSASEVIGINVATAGADNISFAIPINDVKGLIETVLEQGKLVRPYLGVRYVSITDDIAFNLDLKVKRGAYIPEGNEANPSIISGSPAEKAGLQPKDIITEIEGIKLDEKNSVVSILGKRKVGDSVELKILRGKDEKTLSVTLEAAPEQ